MTTREHTQRRDFLKLAAVTLIGGALAVATPLSPAQAQDEPVTGGTLIWGHSETTQNLDIHQTGTASTLRLLENVHDPIVTVDENLKVVPNLAESFEVSDDGLTFTFRLRDDVKFHNGKALTSADVKYSFERAKDPETGAVNYEVFNDVESIETPDDLTVVVNLSQPYRPFLSRLAENGAGAIMPEGTGEEQGAHPVGAGPFAFVRREFGNEVELVRFDDYWGGPAYLDRVIAREITEPTVRLTGLRTGELHLINDIPADRMQEVRDDESLQVLNWVPLNWDFVNFNHALEIFQDRRVREAFDLMIDKQVLLEGALWGEGQLTASPSYPASDSYHDKLAQRPQDIERAKALLAEAGYGPGELDIVFKVTTNYPYHVESAQIMHEWFRQAGVNVSIEQLTWSDWLSQVWVDRDFQMTMMNFFTLWEPDFLYYTEWHSKGSFNYRNVNDPELDAMLEEARYTLDRGERVDIYKRVQERVHEQVHDVVLWFRNGSIGARPEVRGLDTLVHPNGSNLNFHRVWLAQ